MMLHEDKDAFKVLISSVSQRSNIREDIIEKDYYLTLLLSQLADKQVELPAYFKGGTALYKAIGRMIRFSEDIDLTVEIRDCSRNQGKRRLEKAANGYSLLPRTDDKSLEINNKGSITTVYVYEPMTVIDTQDQLQRFGRVKVEATSFTISEPYESLEVSALIYSEATPEQQKILASNYDLKPFIVNTIKLERIFADKILAAEFYYSRNMLFDTAKHIFDLSVMMEMPRIKEMLSQPDEFITMLSYKRIEERERIGSDLSDKPFSEFELFGAIGSDMKLQRAFEQMQGIYVFQDEDLLAFATVQQRLERLNDILLSLDEGLSVEAEPTHEFTLKI